jgi:hypothetical protein
MKKKKAFSLLLIVFLITASFIQNGGAATVSDSSSKVKHYTKFDSSMFHFSNETKLGRFIFKNLYRQPQQDVKPIDNMQSKQKQDRINRYEGKIIRNVYYKTLDPFGTEVDDTLILRRGFIEDIGNKVNLGTRQNNIQSLILFKKGDKVDPLRVKESERLLRRQEYIRDARIIIPAKTNSVILLKSRSSCCDWSNNF